MNPFAEYENIVPILAPVDIAGNATETPFMDLKTAHQAAFVVYFGVLTTATAADHIDVTLVAATSSATTSEAAVTFSYRLSAATGTNTWGAITAALAAGVEIASTDDGKALWIEIDPAAIQAQKADARFVSVHLTPDGMAASLVSVIGMISPRYRQTTMVSAVT